MFDFAGSEILLIGIVALVAIGPKDLPVAIKAVSQMVKKARKMAGEFQTHVDEMVREADLGDVRDSFNDIRRMDIKGKILRAVDTDGSIRNTLSKPVDFSPPPPPVPVHDTITEPADKLVAEQSPSPLSEVAVAPHPEFSTALSSDPAPDFVPPRYAPAPMTKAARMPPAFIPPAFAPFTPVPPVTAPVVASTIEHA